MSRAVMMPTSPPAASTIGKPENEYFRARFSFIISSTVWSSRKTTGVRMMPFR